MSFARLMKIPPLKICATVFQQTLTVTAPWQKIADDGTLRSPHLYILQKTHSVIFPGYSQ